MSLCDKLIEARVARWWGILPWELRALSPVKIAELRAIYDAEKSIEAYYNTEECRKIDASKPKN